MKDFQISIFLIAIILLGSTSIPIVYPENNSTNNTSQNRTHQVSDSLSIYGNATPNPDTPNFELGKRINQLNETVSDIKSETSESNFISTLAIIISILGIVVAVGLFLKERSDRKTPDSIIRKQGEILENARKEESQRRQNVLNWLQLSLKICRNDARQLQEDVLGKKDEKFIQQSSKRLKDDCVKITSVLNKESNWLDEEIYKKIGLAVDTNFQFSRGIDERNQEKIEGIERPSYDAVINEIDNAKKAISDYKLP